MAEFHRRANSTWQGDLRSGSGVASTESGALSDAKITFVSRFENAGDSNPEELVAAAHAACYSMALANGLSKRGHVPASISTKATVTLRMDENGIKITKIHLETEGNVSGIDAATFQTIAAETKEACPISKLLIPGVDELTLEARLIS